MPDTREFQEFVNEKDSFKELVEKADSERYSQELLTGVEELGFEIYEIMDITVKGLSARELGWLWIVWEDHHDGDPTPQEAQA